MTLFPGTTLKIILGGDLLRVKASCQCNSSAREALSPLVGLRFTTLLGSIGEAL